jgi:hypothetical protein
MLYKCQDADKLSSTQFFVQKGVFRQPFDVMIRNRCNDGKSRKMCKLKKRISYRNRLWLRFTLFVVKIRHYVKRMRGEKIGSNYYKVKETSFISQGRIQAAFQAPNSLSSEP